MDEQRFFPSKSPEDMHVQWHGRQPLGAADDMRDAHQMIVHHGGKMVGGQAI